MHTATPQQITCIRTIISRASLAAQKEAIILGFTNGRTSSTKQLTFAEASEVIRHLKTLQKPLKATDRSYKMRGKILSHAHELGWYIPGTRSLDYKRIDAWCIKFGHGKKKLTQYTYEELPKLVSQFNNVLNDFIDKL